MFSGDGLPFTRHSDVLHATATDNESLVRLVEELKRRGNVAFQQKSYEEAEVLYSRAIEVNSSSNPLGNQHIFFANRSASRCAMGKTTLALEDAEACLALDAGYAKGYFRKAQALNKLKRYKEALNVLAHAKTLEPGNKSVNTLYTQVEELAKKEKEAPPVEAPEPPKKVTRVEVVKETSGAASTTTSAAATASKENVDDEDLGGNVRGYKKLADGRVTTFFNNELTEEARQLIGDIAPKKVEDPNIVQIKNVEGGSAWNQGNTFEEKDMTSWGKAKVEELVTGVSAQLASSGDVIGVVRAASVADISGDASIAVVRGAKRYIFDFAFTVKCVLQVEGSTDTVEGELKFLDMSSDSNSDYDVDIVVPSRYQSPAGKALHAALNSTSSPFRRAVAAQLEKFVKEYHTF